MEVSSFLYQQRAEGEMFGVLHPISPLSPPPLYLDLPIWPSAIRGSLVSRLQIPILFADGKRRDQTAAMIAESERLFAGCRDGGKGRKHVASARREYKAVSPSLLSRS